LIEVNARIERLVDVVDAETGAGGSDAALPKTRTGKKKDDWQKTENSHEFAS
jgi:hypothetical protein